eukprot:353375-Chlamydomonas_euryale.AAC.11
MKGWNAEFWSKISHARNVLAQWPPRTTAVSIALFEDQLRCRNAQHTAAQHTTAHCRMLEAVTRGAMAPMGCQRGCMCMRTVCCMMRQACGSFARTATAVSQH